METTSLTTNRAIAAGGILGGMFASVAIIGLAWLVLQIVGWWKLFVKAGEPGWKSIIPVYNLYIAFKIVGIMPWWPVILFVASFIIGLIFPSSIDANGNYVANQNAAAGVLSICVGVITLILDIYYCFKLSKAFGKGAGTAIAAIFFPNIVAIVLGFGKSKYDKKAMYKA